MGVSVGKGLLYVNTFDQQLFLGECCVFWGVGVSQVFHTRRKVHRQSNRVSFSSPVSDARPRARCLHCELNLSLVLPLSRKHKVVFSKLFLQLDVSVSLLLSPKQDVFSKLFRQLDVSVSLLLSPKQDKTSSPNSSSS